MLLNQGLTTEANNNTRGRKLPLPFFTNNKEEGKKRKKERRKERGKETVNIAESSTRRRRLLVNTFPTKQQRRERALHTTRETTRVYIKTRSQTTRSSPHRKRTNTDLSFKRAAQREKEEKHFKIERERSLKSARDLDLDVPIDRIEEV